MRTLGFSLLALCTLTFGGCEVDDAPDDAGDSAEKWEPGITYATARKANERGLLDRRGLIHAHSFYSHDACDGAPHDDNGVYDQSCLDDFRSGLCAVQHDFVFLTDHGDSFSDNEFPDTLLYREAAGDLLVQRAGAPVSSWMNCDATVAPLVMAGNEGNLMPVGLEAHVADTPSERGSIYGTRSAASIDAMHARGAVVLQQHTEDYSVDELIDMPIDGFEMFNLHANMYLSITAALDLTLRLTEGDTDGLPYSDLVGVRLITEDPAYLSRWGSVLSRGVRRVTTMGTDCHRNSFPGLLPDGERIDSYRRMMLWFSNHLLVRPDDDGSWDDRHLKEALREGRLYGAFEILGYPVGFDFIAEDGGTIAEMGGETDLTAGLSLVVKTPSVENLDPDVQAPVLTTRILRAIEGGWEEVASTDDDELRYTPDSAGAYRAEIRMLPRHLTDHLGSDRIAVMNADRVWIYANAIFVR